MWECPVARQVWTKWTSFWGSDPPSPARIFQRSAPPFPARLQLTYTHWYGPIPDHWESFLATLWEASVTVLAHYLWIRRNRRVFVQDDAPASSIAASTIRHLRAHLVGVGHAWLLRRATQSAGTLLLRIVPVLFEETPAPFPTPLSARLRYAQVRTPAGDGCVWLLTADTSPVTAGWRWAAAAPRPRELQVYQVLRDGARFLQRPTDRRVALQISGPSRLVTARINGHANRKQRATRLCRQGLADVLQGIEYRGTISDATPLQPLVDAASASQRITSFFGNTDPRSCRTRLPSFLPSLHLPPPTPRP